MRIVDAARQHFAVNGYERTTVRSVARQAGVSPNLITRYFGGKRGLFVAATEIDLHIRDVLAGPPGSLGRRIAQHVVNRWEQRPGDDPLLIMMRAAMTDREAARHLAAYFQRQAVVPLTDHLARPGAPEQAVAVGAMILGTVVQRYVLKAGPVADASAEEVTRWLAHALQQLLSDPPFRPLGSPRSTVMSDADSAQQVTAPRSPE